MKTDKDKSMFFNDMSSNIAYQVVFFIRFIFQIFMYCVYLVKALDVCDEKYHVKIEFKETN